MIEDERTRVLRRLERLSDKYHRLSLLTHELHQSIKIETRNMRGKDFRNYLKELGLDIEKIKSLSLTMNEITIKDLVKGK